MIDCTACAAFVPTHATGVLLVFSCVCMLAGSYLLRYMRYAVVSCAAGASGTKRRQMDVFRETSSAGLYACLFLLLVSHQWLCFHGAYDI